MLIRQLLQQRLLSIRELVVWFLLLGSLSIAGPAFLAALDSHSREVEQLVRAFESSYRNVRTVRAEFTQTYTMGGRTRRETGTVYFARGGRMHWNYRKPEKKLFISDGKKLLLYIAAENQLRRSPVKSSGDIRVPFRLLLSRPDLRRVFSRFEFADEVVNYEPGNRVLRAFPKRGEEEDYREVLIELTPAMDIRRLVISFADRSSMEFTFDRIERNVILSSRLFTFTPPQGTQIIDQP